MRLWRLARKRFTKNPLGGEGGLHASARWHTAPRRVIYASESLALATLEILVHIDPDLAPRDLIALEIEIPDSVATTEIPAGHLPRSWAAPSVAVIAAAAGRRLARRTHDRG